MAFYGEIYMSVGLEKNIQILFINNYAEHVGGAIFAEETKDEACFLQLATPYSKCSEIKYNQHLSFVFTNNTAHNGGDAIYGGSLQRCITGHCKDEQTPIVGAYIFINNYWNVVQYNTGHGSILSLVSSAPSCVCLHEDREPDCLTTFANDTRYPGETFTISAVVVGQGFGTADGTVYAQFTNKYASRLKQLQQSQQVNHTSCTKLKYTVLSANKNELMVLSARPTTSESWGSPAYIAYITKRYKDITQYAHQMFVMYVFCHEINAFLASKVFINITLLPCPPGFMFSDQSSKCICHDMSPELWSWKFWSPGPKFSAKFP